MPGHFHEGFFRSTQKKKPGAVGEAEQVGDPVAERKGGVADLSNDLSADVLLELDISEEGEVKEADLEVLSHETHGGGRGQIEKKGLSARRHILADEAAGGIDLKGQRSADRGVRVGRDGTAAEVCRHPAGLQKKQARSIAHIDEPGAPEDGDDTAGATKDTGSGLLKEEIARKILVIQDEEQVVSAHSDIGTGGKIHPDRRAIDGHGAGYRKVGGVDLKNESTGEGQAGNIGDIRPVELTGHPVRSQQKQAGSPEHREEIGGSIAQGGEDFHRLDGDVVADILAKEKTSGQRLPEDTELGVQPNELKIVSRRQGDRDGLSVDDQGFVNRGVGGVDLERKVFEGGNASGGKVARQGPGDPVGESEEWAGSSGQGDEISHALGKVGGGTDERKEKSSFRVATAADRKFVNPDITGDGLPVDIKSHPGSGDQ